MTVSSFRAPAKSLVTPHDTPAVKSTGAWLQATVGYPTLQVWLRRDNYGQQSFLRCVTIFTDPMVPVVRVSAGRQIIQPTRAFYHRRQAQK